jgi:predicted lipoprotein with Yx(FWY)xxD motif
MAGIYRPALPARGSSQASQKSRRSRRMLRLGAAVSGIVAAAVVVAACGSSGESTPSSGGGTGGSASSGGNGGNAGATGGTVSTRQLTGIGTALVNSSGMTIYTPKTPAEAKGNIKCTGSCLSFWFPVTGSPADLASSGLPGKIGTIHRPGDGKTQLTYNGKPLYTFRLDTAAGQAHGNNFTDKFAGTSFTWEVVVSHGTAGSAATTPSSSPSYSYGNGY